MTSIVDSIQNTFWSTYVELPFLFTAIIVIGGIRIFIIMAVNALVAVYFEVRLVLLILLNEKSLEKNQQYSLHHLQIQEN